MQIEAGQEQTAARLHLETAGTRTETGGVDRAAGGGEAHGVPVGAGDRKQVVQVDLPAAAGLHAREDVLTAIVVTCERSTGCWSRWPAVRRKALLAVICVSAGSATCAPPSASKLTLVAVATWLRSIVLPVPVTVRLKVLRLVGLPQSTVPELESVTLPTPLLLAPPAKARHVDGAPGGSEAQVSPVGAGDRKQIVQVDLPAAAGLHARGRQVFTAIVVTWERSNRLPAPLACSAPKGALLPVICVSAGSATCAPPSASKLTLVAVAIWLRSIVLPVPVTFRLRVLRLVGLPQSTVPELESVTLPMPLLLVPPPRLDTSMVPPEAVRLAVFPLVLVTESRLLSSTAQ